jgi:Asp/Glu/hydantoin racemase
LTLAAAAAAERSALAAAGIGVIMLDTAFPRPVGDIGNPDTFAGRALFAVVPGARVGRLDDPDLAAAFVSARDSLVRRGARLITTSCGFLATHQARLQGGCPVPVVASALLQLPRRQAALAPGQRLGVLTMDSRRLPRAMLDAVGAAPDVAVQGLEDGHTLFRVLSANDPAAVLDPARAAADVVAAGRALLARAPAIGAIVLECANLPPYRQALAAALGLPVYDILTLLAETV